MEPYPCTKTPSATATRSLVLTITYGYETTTTNATDYVRLSRCRSPTPPPSKILPART